VTAGVFPSAGEADLRGADRTGDHPPAGVSADKYARQNLGQLTELVRKIQDVERKVLQTLAVAKEILRQQTEMGKTRVSRIGHRQSRPVLCAAGQDGQAGEGNGVRSQGHADYVNASCSWTSGSTTPTTRPSTWGVIWRPVGTGSGGCRPTSRRTRSTGRG